MSLTLLNPAQTDLTKDFNFTGALQKSGVNVATMNDIEGLDTKPSCRFATAAALPANTYNGGTKRLTASANAALSVDGTAVSVNDRILVKDEAAGANNGLYKVIQTGDGASPYILERTADADVSADITPNLYVWIEAGSTNADSGWVLTTDGTITLDTTALVFTQFSGMGMITAGDALSKTGNTIDWEPDDVTLEVNTDQARIKDLGVAYAKLAAAVNARLGRYDRRKDFTATAAQVNFDLDVADADLTAGGTLVWKNGQLLRETDDYTLSDNGGAGGVDRVVLVSGAAEFDKVTVLHKRTGSVI